MGIGQGQRWVHTTNLKWKIRGHQKIGPIKTRLHSFLHLVLPDTTYLIKVNTCLLVIYIVYLFSCISLTFSVPRLRFHVWAVQCIWESMFVCSFVCFSERVIDKKCYYLEKLVARDNYFLGDYGITLARGISSRDHGYISPYTSYSDSISFLVPY